MPPQSTPAERALEHMSNAVLLMGADNCVRYINGAAQVMFAVSARQVTGQRLPSHTTPCVRALESAARNAIETGEPFTNRELSLEVSPDRRMTVDLTVTPVSHDEVLLEVSELDRRLRITREQNLINQNHATRHLLRGLAHEVKNPLGGLRGAAQLLHRELQAPELREYTQIIIEEADRLRTLVNGLLGPSKHVEKQETNIHEVLERVRGLVVAEAPEGVTIHRDYDPSIPTLLAEPNQLIQATLNIARNALQSLDGTGSITLRTRTQRQFTIADVPHRLVVRVDIIDTGPGIPKDLQDRIFYPMVTGRAEGTGLGLSIAQTLIHQHGGLIECWSEPGHTEFTLWLPLEADDDNEG
ncbi:nitrogen regulation protein NR(II) [Aquisalimonas sp.]|uniref:nitrogen regulation protein NR(II) n=1 Tax=unclassified Aquisalimonas TaxID=2644645 RepID=UPI0025C26015|nr:nitrogen regulation protein NR(II) [Aquisalimonas sp.]